jgi:hypothetical protein
MTRSSCFLCRHRDGGSGFGAPIAGPDGRGPGFGLGAPIVGPAGCTGTIGLTAP